MNRIGADAPEDYKLAASLHDESRTSSTAPLT
jgi:hypothetical protein